MVQAAGTDVRPHAGDRAPPVRRVDRGQTVGTPAPGNAGPLGAAGAIDWSTAVIDSITVRAERGELTGPSPVNRGKPGSKSHVLSDRAGRPLTALTSAANTHDSQLLVPLLDSLAPIRSRRGRPRSRPAKLHHADKAYRNRHLLAELRRRRIAIRIARPGVESSERLGRHRWVIERSLSWLMRHRRLVPLRGRLADHFQGFVTIACLLVIHRQLVKIPK